jgi:lysophospholipase L1-like esterase
MEIVIGVLAGVIVLSIAAAAIGVRVRQDRGRARLADTIPVNSRFWREERANHGDLLYVAIGDSAAQGIGASQPVRSYVGLIAEHIRSSTGRSVRVVNLSHSGARFREALAEQSPKLAGLDPDIITVAIGANDVPTFDPARFEREAVELFSALPTHAIVADLPSFHVGQAERTALRASAIVRRAAGARALRVAPLHATTRRRGLSRAALRDVAADFFHPNDRGYRAWAAAFLPLVEERMAVLRDRGAA